jgi:hypothetical protein
MNEPWLEIQAQWRPRVKTNWTETKDSPRFLIIQAPSRFYRRKWMDGRSCCEVGHDRWAYPHACLAHQLKWHGSRGEKSFGSGRRKKFEDVRLRASQAQTRHRQDRRSPAHPATRVGARLHMVPFTCPSWPPDRLHPCRPLRYLNLSSPSFGKLPISLVLFLCFSRIKCGACSQPVFWHTVFASAHIPLPYTKLLTN